MPFISPVPLQYAGPVAATWGWVLIVAMTLTIALSMAEICSSLPTTGGVYCELGESGPAVRCAGCSAVGWLARGWWAHRWRLCSGCGGWLP